MSLVETSSIPVATSRCQKPPSSTSIAKAMRASDSRFSRSIAFRSVTSADSPSREDTAPVSSSSGVRVTCHQRLSPPCVKWTSESIA